MNEETLLQELWNQYAGGVIATLATATTLGIIATVRNFFRRIRKMGKRIDDLETKLDANTRSDEQLQKFVDIMIAKKLNQ